MQTAYVEIGGQARTALVGGPSQLSRLQAFKLILQGRAETHYHVATISSKESAEKDLVLAFFQLYNTCDEDARVSSFPCIRRPNESS